MSLIRHSRLIRPASLLALCETLESRLFLAADTFTFAPLVSFQTRTTGSQPSGLVVDSDGTIFGVTTTGGAKNYGTIFKIAAGDSTPTTLASFTGIGDNGISPIGDLYLDSDGHLFGTTTGGGTFKKGTIFTIDVSDSASTATIITLASFDGVNGSFPLAGLVADPDGNLFGTATGSTTRRYASTVWTLAANDSSHTITTLATFNAKDLLTGQLATTPDGLLATDADGHIFGTTRNGGTRKLGSIFQVNADHSVTTLASFSSTTGTHASGTLIRNDSGTFFGTALNGGANGYGTLFQFSTASGLAVIGTFNFNNGAHPLGKLVLDADGNLFGVTSTGGAKNLGTVFQRSAGTDNTISTVFSLASARNGRNPTTLAADSQGNLFVATFAGGTSNAGAIFVLHSDQTVFATPPVPVVLTPATLYLNILQQPTTSIAVQQTFSLKADVRSLQGNIGIVSGTATLSITSGPSGGTLAGTQTVAFVFGVATFTDLSLTVPGIYTLQISAPSLVSALTATITVT